MNKFRTSCVAVLLLVNLAHAQPAQQMSARQIMDRAAAVYASCRTYSDEGVASVDIRIGSYRSPRVQPFSTNFVRTSGFRYEFRMRRGSEWDSYIAWKNGATEKSWWSFSQHDEPVAKALSSFAKLSAGSAQTIPALLQPDLSPTGSVVNSLQSLRLEGEEKLDGRAAFKIEGELDGQKTKVWIDRQEFLILKIFQEEKGRGYSIETTTIYKPVVNVEIASDRLAFNPPAAVLITGNHEKSQPGASQKMSSGGNSLVAKQNDSGTYQKTAIVNSEDDDVVRVETTLVPLDVLALDKQGRIVRGLSKEDFLVVEDGQPQTVTTFALGDDLSRSRSIVLIIDYSGSQLPFIKTSVDAAKTLVDKLNPNDRMQIVTDDVEVLVDFTSDKGKLKEKLDSLWEKVSRRYRLGRSSQYSALMATLDKISEKQSGRPIIIFQTDGDELPVLRSSASYPPPFPMAPPTNEKPFSIVDIFASTLKSKATIYSVVPGIRLMGFSQSQQVERARKMLELSAQALKEFRPELKNRGNPFAERIRSEADWLKEAQFTLWRQKALATLAELSGGWADVLEQPDQSADIYGRILADINDRYIIGYQPTNKERDGKLRMVNVEVRGHPEYTVWGRKSYYAPGAER